MKRIYLTIYITLLLLCGTGITTKIFSQVVWNSISTGTQFNIHELSFPNDSIGYFVADTIAFTPESRVYRTQNRGQIWSLVNSVFYSLQHLSAPSSNVVYVNGNNGLYSVLRKTVNGGGTWLNQNINSPEGPMEFINDTLGFIASSGGLGNRLWRTGNSGNSFDSAYFGGYSCAMFDIQYVTDSIAYAGGLYGPKLAKTTQQLGGWVDQSNDYAVRAVCFLNKDTGFAVAEYIPFFTNSQVIRTYNGGFTWTQLPGSNDPAGNGWTKIHCRNSQECLCVGGGGSAASTSDGGFTWVSENTGTTENLLDVYFGSNYAVAAGENGTVLRRILLTTGLNENNQNLSLRLSPNPATNAIRIDGALQKGDRIVLMDVQGRTLYSSICTTNGQQLPIAIDTFQDGVYFVSIQEAQQHTVLRFIKQ